MIAGVSITTLLLVLVAGIGAGFVGYSAGAFEHHKHGGRVWYRHRWPAFRS